MSRIWLAVASRLTHFKQYPVARAVGFHATTALGSFGVCLATLLWFTEPNAQAMPMLWPGTGLVLALVWLNGIKAAPSVAVAQLLALALTDRQAAAPTLVIGNVLGGIAAAYLLKAFHFQPTLRRLRDVWTMLVIASTVGPLIAAAVAFGLTVFATDPNTSTPVRSALAVARTTLLLDVFGSVLVAPLILVWSAILASREWLIRRRRIEVAALAAFTLVSCLVAYGLLGALPMQRIYLIVPCLFWAALRFGPGGGMLATLVSSTVLGWLTLHGMGVYAADPSVIDLAKVQTFGIVVGLAVPVIAATSSHGKRASEEAGRLRSEARFGKLMEQISDMVLVVDASGRVTFFNSAVQRILGHTPSQLDVLIHADDLPRLQETMVAADDAGAFALQLRHASGAWVPVEAVVTDCVGDPQIGGWVLSMRDITERRRAEAELRYQAFHDTLTGLPNRALFGDRLAHALARAGRHGRRAGVVFLDLDNFKHINDSLGHDAGDQLLKEVATRLQRSMRAGDTVGRLGGDEFTMLLEDLESSSDAEHVVERVAEALRRPIELADRAVSVSGSFGIALGGAGDDPGDLLRKADIAMYAAKTGGKARHVEFEPEMEEAARARLELEADLRRVLYVGGGDGLVVYYQPMVDIASGRVREVEALVRWRHPVHGLIPPDRFIPMAEETGLIVPLGAWVLEAACQQVRAWQLASDAAEPLRLSVNLAASQLQDPRFVDDVRRILDMTGLDPRTLQLEITERVAVDDSEQTLAVLMELSELGIGLSIDDFGAGNSALGYLTRFPVTNLKIDRAFVAGLGTESRSHAVVRGVVALAHALDLTVTGEGIETAEQLEHLRAMGCHQAQGYFLGRPVPASVISDQWPVVSGRRSRAVWVATALEDQVAA